MELGSFTIEQLSEGQFEIFADGVIHRKPVDSPESMRRSKLSGKNSSRIGINPILISRKKHHILLDAGLGWGLDTGSEYKDVSNVETNLDIFDLEPEDITHVILSHLHYDHAAGCSFTDGEAATRPTFPNARYYVQQREWDHALSRLDRQKQQKGAGYRLDDLYRLVADGYFEFVEEDHLEVIKGVQILWTGGHTPGHQVVRISSGKKSAYYLGDLLPSENHLNHYAMRQMDTDPLQAKKMKTQLLKSACEENAWLLFYHSLFSKVGRLERDDQKKFVLKEMT